ncbi:MAG: methyltransferase domain-containing protein, partial [Candidatus Omnitrophota bacterium]
KSVMGLEMEQEYIELGKALASRENVPLPKILQGSVEEVDLHIPDDSFDLVFCRLVLAYTDIKMTMRKISNILRPKGIVWINTESFMYAIQCLLNAFKKRERLASIGSWIFTVLNSIVFMATGIQMKVKVQGRMHKEHKSAYPTLRFWKSACAAAGLKDFHLVRVYRGGYIFWVRKE